MRINLAPVFLVFDANNMRHRYLLSGDLNENSDGLFPGWK